MIPLGKKMSFYLLFILVPTTPIYSASKKYSAHKHFNFVFIENFNIK